MPTGGVFGTGATDLFCSGVAKGSKALVLLLRNPVPMLLAIGAILGLRRPRRRPCDVDPERAAADRAATLVGSDHLGVGARCTWGEPAWSSASGCS